MKFRFLSVCIALICVLLLLASCKGTQSCPGGTEDSTDTTAAMTEGASTPSEDITEKPPFSEGEHAFAYVYKYTDPSTGHVVYEIEDVPRETVKDHTVLDHVLYGPTDAFYIDHVLGYGGDAGEKIFISAGGSTYVYTPKTRVATEFFLPEGADINRRKYSVIFDESTSLPAALCVEDDNGKYAVYSFAANAFVSEHIYDICGEGAVNGRLLMYIENHDEASLNNEEPPRVTNYMISLADGELLATHTEEHRGYYMFLVSSPDGKTAYYQSCFAYIGSGFQAKGQLYTSEFVPFGPADALYPAVTENGELYCTAESDGSLLRFAPDGTELDTPESVYLEKILQIFHNCIVAVGEDRFVHVVDLDGNLIKTICEWTDDMFYHRLTSGWKPKTELYEAGLYLLFETNGKGFEYGYIPTQESLYYEEIPDGFAYAKPVLYLYPEEECEVDVSLAYADRITVSYPAYPENGWSVTAQPDGTLTDGTREYYCLYWEEDCVYDTTFDEGFCVAGKDSAAFLEDALAKLGLTEREANECIVYWLPILESSPYNCIYFECTAERQAKSPLLITPTPDTLIRVALHIRPSDTFVSLPAQNLTAPERIGFAAVEWGGVIVK